MENNSADTANESLEGQLLDYKIFTFDGEPGFVEFDFNRFVSHKILWFPLLFFGLKLVIYKKEERNNFSLWYTKKKYCKT